MTATTVERLHSFEEYLQYDDGTDNRYELVKGKLEPMNPPTIRHLLIADFLQDVLKAEIARMNSPWLCFKEAGVRTGLRKSRLVDVCVVSRDQVMDALDRSAVFQTPPLLVIEIVSPESVNRDYRYKRSEYAAAEIPEYWIVDPMVNQISVLRLEEGLYEESQFTQTQPIVSQQFADLNVTVDQVFAAANLGTSSSELPS
jgi:Uma2 family endonuclease